MNVLSLLLLVIAPRAFANDWHQIKINDAKITNCHAEWHLVFRQYPISTNSDDAKSFAASLNQYQRNGMSSTQAEAMAKNDIATIQRNRAGFELPQDLVYEYDGKGYLADDQYGLTTVSGSNSNAALPINQYINQTIESFDGQDYVELEHSVPRGVNPKKSPFVGTAYRDATFGHSHSFGIWPGSSRGGTLFLFGRPVTDVFNAGNSTLNHTSSQSVVIEQRIPGANSSQTNASFLIRAKISTQCWRPLEVSIFNSTGNRLLIRYRPEGYRLYPGNIWFPSKLNITKYSTHQGKNLASVPFTEEDYSLIRVSFNKKADVRQLGSGIPPHSTINDFRLGDAASVTYTTTKVLMPEKEVLGLYQSGLDFDRKAEQRQQGRHHQNTMIGVLSTAVAFFVMIFLFLSYRRSLDKPSAN